MNGVEQTSFPDSEREVSVERLKRFVCEGLSLAKKKPTTMLITALLWIIGLAVIVNLVVLLVRVSSFLWRPERVTVGEFVVTGQPNQSYSAKFYERWLTLKAATADSGQAAIDLPFLAGSDFIMADIDERAGAELTSAFDDFEKNLDVKVAGISIRGVAQALQGIAFQPARVIEGRVSRYGEEVSLTVILRDRGKRAHSWTFSRNVGEEGAAIQTREEEALFDEAICQIALHLWRERSGHPVIGGTQMDETTASLDAEALANLTNGRRSLQRYLQRSNRNDLLAAQACFRSLVARSPDYKDGYLLLGYALAENRQEREAIDVYERALELMKRAPSRDIQSEFEARFLKASSLLRCYRWEDMIQALNDFRQLAAEIETATATKPSVKKPLDGWRRNRYMLARAYAETAHCIGHLLVLLPKAGQVSADFRRDLVELFGDAQVQLATIADRRVVADRLYSLCKSYQAKAKNVAPIYKKEWQADLASRLSEISGYAQYRHAEWLPAPDDDRFRSESQAAIRSLQQAELRRPRHYALLQNIGMIYLDPRYDARGDELPHAEQYYQRSVELKPSDYYGYEQLARASLRRALAAADPAVREAAIKSADERLVKAVELRPEGRGAVFVRLYCRLAKIASAGKPPGGEELDSLRADIDMFDPGREDPSLQWMRIACDWFALLGSDEGTFSLKRDALRAELDDFAKHVGTPPDRATWREAQMLRSVSQLREKVGGLEFKNRGLVRFDLSAAIG